jgi:hypothetical protein
MGDIQHKDQYLRPFDMPQKLKAKSLILMCILYNAGNVRNSHEVIINELDVSD